MSRRKTLAEQQAANDAKIIGLAAKLVLEIPLVSNSGFSPQCQQYAADLRKALIHGGYLAKGAK